MNETRRCNKCSEEKPLTTEFYYHHFDPKRNKSYFKRYCKQCSIKQTIEWRDKTNYSLREALLKREYNMTQDDYDQMLQEQDFCCAICKRHMTEFKRNLAVDHNHTTGEIRGLLCGNCNRTVGFVKENPEIAESLVRYIRFHSRNMTRHGADISSTLKITCKKPKDPKRTI